MSDDFVLFILFSNLSMFALFFVLSICDRSSLQVFTYQFKGLYIDEKSNMPLNRCKSYVTIQKNLLTISEPGCIYLEFKILSKSISDKCSHYDCVDSNYNQVKVKLSKSGNRLLDNLSVSYCNHTNVYTNNINLIQGNDKSASPISLINKPLERKWISCDNTMKTHTENPHFIQDMNKIASPINIFGNQTRILEVVITFVLTITEKGINNFPIEGLSKTQQLEVFLFDACMVKDLLLAKEKIPNTYIPGIDKKINAAYRNLKDRLGIKNNEIFFEAKNLIEIRAPFYLKDLQGLLNSDYPQTKMYMPYGLYFFIHTAPLDAILDEEDAIEGIMNYQSNQRISGNILGFTKALVSHYNWLLNQIDSFNV